MVKITPLVHAAAVLSRFTLADSTSHRLTVRQSNDSSPPPSSCESPCQVVNTIGWCGSNLSCMCTNTIGNQLLQCMTCLVAIDPAHQSSEQSDINSWNKACNGSLSLGSGSSSGGNSSGTTNGTTGGTTSGTTDGTAPSTTTGGSSSGSNPSGSEVGGATGLKIGGVAVCILAALAGAYISL